MSVDSLVAGPVDTSTAFGGAGLLESLSDLTSSLESGSWVAAGLSGVGVALDTAAAVSDPFGSLIAAGLGWLMEHLQPLKGWLNDLTGDAGAVLGHAATWDNVAGALRESGDELDRLVRVDLEDMSGAAIVAYTAHVNALADRVRGAGESASAIGSALSTCATIVQVVHDLVRDTLAQLVGSIVSWASELVFTAGLATPLVVEQVATRVASLAMRVGRSVVDVLTSARALKGLLEAMRDALARFASGVRVRPGSGAAEAAGDAARAVHPSGLPISDGSRRELYEQMMDPQIHPSNAEIVEPDYDPLGGFGSRENFLEEFAQLPSGPAGGFDWRWPPDGGAVPGSVTIRAVRSGETIRLTRIGGDTGQYFAPPGSSFGELALPPDRLNFPRGEVTVDTSHPWFASERIMIEDSTVAPWFGQRGGSPQVRFVTAAGEYLRAEQLKELGLIR